MYHPKLYLAGKLGDFTDGKPVDQRVAQEEANRRSAQQTARHLWDVGFRVIVPHSMMGLPTPTATRKSDIDVDRETIMQTCLEVLADCDVLYVMRNWKRSSGAIREYNQAQRLDMPVLRTYGEAEEYLTFAREVRKPFLPKRPYSHDT
jgi:hypothetical protein